MGLFDDIGDAAKDVGSTVGGALSDAADTALGVAKDGWNLLQDGFRLAGLSLEFLLKHWKIVLTSALSIALAFVAGELGLGVAANLLFAVGCAIVVKATWDLLHGRNPLRDPVHLLVAAIISAALSAGGINRFPGDGPSGLEDRSGDEWISGAVMGAVVTAAPTAVSAAVAEVPIAEVAADAAVAAVRASGAPDTQGPPMTPPSPSKGLLDALGDACDASR
jgi:hypothetical protein